MKESYRQEAQKRIEQAEKDETEQREKSLKSLEDKLQDALHDIERKEQQNHDEWVQALFARIINDQAKKE